MNYSCKQCGHEFVFTEAEKEFHAKISPVIAGKRYDIPPPSLCPEHRLQRRWTFRNESNLYSNRCAKTGKALISMYPPTLPIQVYDQQVWWDKNWDGTEYGRDFDFSRSFFEQFAELLRTVPQPNLLNAATTNENSDYVNCSINLKNCYMVVDAGHNEDCYYCNIVNDSRNCVDCTSITHCELGYGLVGTVNCYKSRFLLNCDNCRDSAFLYACKACSDCFGCYNLRHQQYCWFNEQLTKEEYEERRSQVDLGNYEVYQKMETEFLQLIPSVPREYAYLMNCENCTGNVLTNSHNTHCAFDSVDNQDSKYTISTVNIRDSCDIEHSYNVELCLEVMAATNIYQNFFSCYTINSQYIWYSYLVSASKNCFGCVGLKNQEYCILNKKYSKEAYEELVPRIIAHMIQTREFGEFFPMNISLHGYNESLANDYFPFTREEALNAGAHWSDYEAPMPNATEVIAADALPPSINDVSDDICNKAIRCSVTGKLFKITKQELQFYRSHNVPLPRTCSAVRYQERLKLRLPRKLWQRQCDCTEANHSHTSRCEQYFQSPYALERPEQILCEECYIKVIN